MEWFGQVNLETIGVMTAVFTAITGATLWITNKIFKFGVISQRLTAVEASVVQVGSDVGVIRTDLTKRIDELLIAVVQKGVTSAHSPRQLNAEGKRILQKSGIKELVDEHFKDIVAKVRAQKPQNAYQTEQLVLDAVQDLNNQKRLKDRLEEGAFKSGSLVGVVLYVGGTYVRDKVLAELGMKPEDIDGQRIERR